MSFNEKIRKWKKELKKEKNKIGNYLIGETLEENSYIKIRKGKNVITNQNVTIKIINKSYLYENENNLNNLTAEISILKILHHKNLVRLYELREMTTNLYIIMEHCENKSLFDYVKNYSKNNNINNNYKKNSFIKDLDTHIKENSPDNNQNVTNNSKEENKLSKKNSITINSPKNFSNINDNSNNYTNTNLKSQNYSEDNINSSLKSSIKKEIHVLDYDAKSSNIPELEACRIFQDLIDGLEYLHSQNICLRDLNPHNVYFDYKYTLKIANFSFSKKYKNDKLLKTPIGNLQFTAPEVLFGKGYHGLFSDIWSSGVILYFILTGELPFFDESDEVSLNKIKENKIKFPSYISNEAKELISNMLNKDCLERFDINQIKSHPWFSLNKANLNKGININLCSIPVDQKIIFKLENLDYDIETLRSKIKDNIHDESTALYYLFLKSQIKGGYKSIADMESPMFLDFINDPNNLVKNIEYLRKENKFFSEEREFLEHNNNTSSEEYKSNFKSQNLNFEKIEINSTLNQVLQLKEEGLSTNKEEKLADFNLNKVEENNELFKINEPYSKKRYIESVAGSSYFYIK